MALIVQKFGGSSVADDEKLFHVAKIIQKTFQNGNDVVAVLSAQGDTTDRLIEQAERINPDASKRELDMLMATGEQASVALCAMALEKLGLQAVSLTGWQSGIRTSAAHGAARVLKVDCSRIREELQRGRIVLVAGFQGVDRDGDITTLGRGGSDTTAVALAIALRADLCQIYTDVDGVFTADPRLVPDAKQLQEITYDEMLELASLGAQVLHNRSVELAKRCGIPLEVLSTFSGKPGTVVRETVGVEQAPVSGTALDRKAVQITLRGLDDEPGTAYRLFSLLAENGIGADMILSATGSGRTREISFTISEKDRRLCEKLLTASREALCFACLDVRTDVAKVSAVGAGLMGDPGMAAQLFRAIYEAGIHVHMISTSEIKISVLVDGGDAERALRAVHDQFFPK